MQDLKIEGEAMDLKLTGRTALITGASKGIGLVVAQWFAREGVNVNLVARSGEALKKQAAALATATGVRRGHSPPIWPTLRRASVSTGRFPTSISW